MMISSSRFEIVQLNKAPDGARFADFDCGEQFLNGIAQELVARDGEDLRSYVVVDTQNEENRFVGFVSLALKPIKSKNLYRGESSSNNPVVTIHLDFVAVDKRYQGLRLGSKLIVAALTAAYGMSQFIGGIAGITLDSHPDAVGFYSRHGFDQVSKRTVKSPDGDLELTLMLIKLGTIAKVLSPPPL